MSVKISRILHAGYIFECGHTQIAFDPILKNPFSQNCYAFPNVEFVVEKIKKLKFTAVFISHYHDDHCCIESLNLLDRETPIYMFCVHEEMFSLIRQLGFKYVYSLKLKESIMLGEFKITPMRALDEDVDSIFHIQVKELNILNVVDSWVDYETVDQLKKTTWNMILWPFQTMRELEVIAPRRVLPSSETIPDEWMEQLQMLSPQFLVPSSCQFIHESWSWYNHAFFPITYKNFQNQIKSILLDTQTVRLNPGTTVALTQNSLKPAQALDWIKPVGDQNIDYLYKANIEPMRTADIAKKFRALSDSEKIVVMDYCQFRIIEKYKTLDVLEDSYFNSNKFWKLRLYDHEGAITDFIYQIDQNHLKIIETSSNISLSWMTEISIFKLWNALENGESLSSMYMRINDMEFIDQVEKIIGSIDLGYDPLIRCLFEGAFGSYQKAQLRNLTTPSTMCKKEQE